MNVCGFIFIKVLKKKFFLKIKKIFNKFKKKNDKK